MNANNLYEKYCRNNMAKLKPIVNSLLLRIGGIDQCEMDDYYSIANEMIWQLSKNYDMSKCDNFENYFKSCFKRKIATSLRDKHRDKRCIKKIDEDGNIEYIKEVSLEYKDEEGKALAEIIPAKENEREELSNEMTIYLSNLTEKQRQILELIGDGHGQDYICKELKISVPKYHLLLDDARDLKRTIALTNIFDKNKNRKLKEKAIKIHNTTKTKQITKNKGENAMSTQETYKEKVITIASVRKKMKEQIFRFDHPLQRENGQHTLTIKSNLMSDIMQNNPIGQTIFAEVFDENGIPTIWNLDGKNRFYDMIEYVDGKYAISKKNTYRYMIPYNHVVVEDGKRNVEECVCDIRGKKFNQLPEELQDTILDYHISYIEYLNCTPDDAAYHIKRHNACKPMTVAQKSVICMGENVASRINAILSMSFFDIEKENYKVSERKNGTLQRVIAECVMFTFHRDNWSKKTEDMCKWLSENYNQDDYDEMEGYITSLDDVMTDDVREMFTSRDTFLWMALFDEFRKKEIGSDNEFINFLSALKNNLHDKSFNGKTWDEMLEDRSHRERSTVNARIEYLTALMIDFFSQVMNVEENNTVDNEVSEEIVECLEGSEFGKKFIDSDKAKFVNAIKNIYENVGKDEREIAFDLNVLEECSRDVNKNISIFDSDNLASTVAAVSYMSDYIDKNVLKKWIENAVFKYSNSPLTGDCYHRLYTLTEDMKKFAQLRQTDSATATM